MGSVKAGITRAPMSFFAELKRRNVFRVGAAYGLVGWLLVALNQLSSATIMRRQSGPQGAQE